MTYDEVRKFALTLEGIEEGTSYATRALKMHGHLMVRHRPDLNAIAVATTLEEREELIREQLDIYFITNHYLNYPWVLVRLERLEPAIMRDLIRRARQVVGEKFPPKRKSRKSGKFNPGSSHP